MSFRVGQKVVCVDDSDSDGKLVRGRIYTVLGVSNTCNCGQSIDVGEILPDRDSGGTLFRVGGLCECERCGAVFILTSTKAFFRALRFRPLIEDLTAELARKEAGRIVEEKPEHILEPA